MLTGGGAVQIENRLRGMLVGLAVGDALGAAVEFMAPGSFEPVTDLRGGGPHGLPAGYWTDDTSMALCSAVSLVQCGRFDAEDQMQRFLRWLRDGYLSSTNQCFGIGNRTQAALQRYARSGVLCAGAESFDSAGNGALMRLAPIVMHSYQHPEAALELAVEHCRLTHADPRCLDANRIFARLLLGALRADSVDALWQLLPVCEAETDDWELQQVMAGSFLTRQPPAIRGTGYVVDALEAALWAFAQSTSFEQGVLLAVNLGDDADTTAAIYGQLAGAFYGYQAIPRHWRERLYQQAQILALADRLIGCGKATLPPHWL